MRLEIKNMRVRKIMAANGIDQRRLANIMHISDTEASVMLKRELAKAEQDEIIKTIKEWSIDNS